MNDPFILLHNLVLGQQSAFVAGLIAAFTPCTLALIPVFLYRFGVWGQQKPARLVRELGLVVSGYMVSFLLSGLVFQSLLGSELVNITRLVLGSLLVTFAVVQLSGRAGINLNLSKLPAFGLGLAIPAVVSFSPCVLPFFSVLLINGGGRIADLGALTSFLLFGTGLLLPAIGLALLGQSAFRLLRQISRLTKVVETLSPLLILISGVYLMSQMVSLSQRDALMASLSCLLILLAVAGMLFRKPARRTFGNVELFIFLLVLGLVLLVIQLNAGLPSVSIRGTSLLHACLPGGNTTSAAEAEVSALFILQAILLGLWIVLADRPGKRFFLTW